MIDSSRQIIEPDPQMPGPAGQPQGPQGPQVEVLSRPEGPRSVREPLSRSRRFKVFAAVFLLVLGVGSIWNFSRPAIYRASASVLIEVPEGIGYRAGTRGTDLQNVTAQGRILLARDLLEETLRLAADRGASVSELVPETLRTMLDVLPTPQTNLVELAATGSDPDRLAALVNAWVDVYIGRRQKQVQTDVDETLARVQDEYDRLDAEKQEKAEALDDYRVANGIDTTEGSGNQALARLRSLTEELNAARTKQVEAETELETLEKAIARGDPVVPPDEQAGLDALSKQASALRGKLAGLEKRYTRLYLENEPSLREVPKELDRVESLIASKIVAGREYLRAEATRAVERSRRRTELLEQQLAVARSEASRFTAKLERYKRLKTDLEQVDELHRKVEARLVEIKAKAPERYQQVEVLEPAFAPRIPLQPDFWRDFLYNLGAAAVAALLSILLLEFLGRREREESEMLPVTGVRIFGAGADPLAHAPDATALPAGQQGAIAQEPTPSLPGAVMRELLPEEVRALTGIADPASRQLIGLIMSGLTPQECAALDEAHFDLDRNLLRAPEEGREITLDATLGAELGGHRPVPLWSGASGAADVDGLLGRIALLAHDAGVARPAEVDGAALRHTYVCYVVRQGARLTEIERVIGPMSAAELGRYGAYSPGGAAKPLAAIDLSYPAFDPGPDSA